MIHTSSLSTIRQISVNHESLEGQRYSKKLLITNNTDKEPSFFSSAFALKSWKTWHGSFFAYLMKAFGICRIYTISLSYKWVIRWANPQNKHEITLYGQYIKYTDVVDLLGVFRPTREFFTHIETSPLPVKGSKYWIMLGMKGHWQWGIFSVAQDIKLHVQWSSRVADCLAVELSLPVLTNLVCRDWDSNTQPSASESNTLTDCAIHRRGEYTEWKCRNFEPDNCT